jgi:hypothetical protein
MSISQIAEQYKTFDSNATTAARSASEEYGKFV